MTTLIICAILGGISAIWIIMPINTAKPKLCYALMLLIPLVSLSLFLSLTMAGIIPTPNAPVLSDKNRNARTIDEINTLKAALKKDRDNHDAIAKLAGLYISQERYQEAITLIKTTPKEVISDDLNLMLGTAYFAQGLYQAEHKDDENALLSLRQALAVSPSSAPFLPDIKHFIKIISDHKDKAQ